MDMLKAVLSGAASTNSLNAGKIGVNAIVSGFASLLDRPVVNDQGSLGSKPVPAKVDFSPLLDISKGEDEIELSRVELVAASTGALAAKTLVIEPEIRPGKLEVISNTLEDDSTEPSTGITDPVNPDLTGQTPVLPDMIAAALTVDPVDAAKAVPPVSEGKFPAVSAQHIDALARLTQTDGTKIHTQIDGLPSAAKGAVMSDQSGSKSNNQMFRQGKSERGGLQQFIQVQADVPRGVHVSREVAKPGETVDLAVGDVERGRAAADSIRLSSAVSAGPTAPAKVAAAQIHHGFVKLGPTGGSMTISMSPEELGRVEVVLAKKDGQFTARIVVDRSETMDLVRSEMRNLERSLIESGFDVRSGSIALSMRQDQAGAGGEGHAGEPGRAERELVEASPKHIQKRLAEGKGLRLNISV